MLEPYQTHTARREMGSTVRVISTTVVHGMAYCEVHKAHTITQYTHTLVMPLETRIVCDACLTVIQRRVSEAQARRARYYK